MDKEFDDPMSYYACHGPISSPGKFAPYFEDLSTEISDLCKLVQGFLLHIFWAKKYDITLNATRKEEAGLRHIERMVARGLALDPVPLTQARLPEKRLIGNCRNFSVLLCALLRHQGVPARARCGFAKYFAADWHEDHWVCEYWHPTRKQWILVDAQLDEFQCQVLEISFNPLDVPRDQFLVGGRAWHLCRSHQAGPESFGIFDMHGLWFVRGNLVRDVAALNKMPLLPWDIWGLIEGQDESISPADLAFLDRIAAASMDNIDYSAVRALYKSDLRLRVPQIIHSYTERGVLSIDVASEAEVNQTFT
jgi:hypothetical protein